MFEDRPDETHMCSDAAQTLIMRSHQNHLSHRSSARDTAVQNGTRLKRT